MLNCKQASKLISQSLDRRLSWAERCQLKLHLIICTPCRRFARQLKLMAAAIHLRSKIIENDQDIKLSPEVKNKILQASKTGSMQNN